jgi:hypothetical protein
MDMLTTKRKFPPLAEGPGTVLARTTLFQKQPAEAARFMVATIVSLIMSLSSQGSNPVDSSCFLDIEMLLGLPPLWDE